MKNYLILFIVPFLSACYTDKEELLYPENTCENIENVSYISQVTPILDSQCLTCHGSINADNIGGSIKLDSYGGFKLAVENLDLLKAIKHESGASQMPKNAAKLGDCDIQIIETWVNEGAQDN